MTSSLSLACHACGCIHDKARLVRLINGREVSNHSEEWRHETEARSIAQQSFGDRAERMRTITKMRGAASAQRLEKTISEIRKG